MEGMKGLVAIIALILVWICFLIFSIFWDERVNQKEKESEEIEATYQEPMDFNDTISMDQVRRMDSLHAAGKL